MRDDGLQFRTLYNLGTHTRVKLCGCRFVVSRAACVSDHAILRECLAQVFPNTDIHNALLGLSSRELVEQLQPQFKAQGLVS
jgi:putative ubiquitin-RnfH superfamily antitoxin RatB of RatAB toxin-antitoxin module